jgi:hypothetical protein
MSELRDAAPAALLLRVSVPAGGELHAIAIDVGAKVAEHLGGAAAAPAVHAAMADVAAQVAPGDADAVITFEFQQQESGVRIEAMCAGRTSGVHCRIAG